ncbi:hypothetical protein GCM10010300_68870 [Streptomyces olivaceoviridis]|nr:hypothetical protein GCM10010300_68870 [Streptomyces olivaceoviridis]
MSKRQISGESGVLSVDHTLCSGTGHCVDRLPQLFTIEHGRAWLADAAALSTVDTQHLHEVEAGCPWFAITYQPRPPAPAEESSPATPGLE